MSLILAVNIKNIQCCSPIHL